MAYSLTMATHKLDKPILQALDSTGVETAVHTLGYKVRSTDGREFTYVEFDNGTAVAAVAGGPAFWQSDTTAYTATSDASAGADLAIGAFCSILTDAYYGWIQTEGLVVDPPSSGTQAVCAAGDVLYGTDAVWKTGAIGTNHIGAVALETGTGAVGDIMLIKS